MIEGVYEREGRCAIKGSAVVQCGSDTDRGLVDIGDAEVDFSHFEGCLRKLRCRMGELVDEGECHRNQLPTLIAQLRTVQSKDA